MKIHRAGIDAIKIASRWAGCPQAPCFHTVCAVNAQTWRNCYLMPKGILSYNKKNCNKKGSAPALSRQKGEQNVKRSGIEKQKLPRV